MYKQKLKEQEKAYMKQVRFTLQYGGEGLGTKRRYNWKVAGSKRLGFP